MSSTTNRNLEKPAHNADIDTWDVPVNSNSDIIDSCFGNITPINLTGLSSYTLTTTDLQSFGIRFTGTLNSGSIPVKIPVGIGGTYAIINQTSQTDATSSLSMSWSSGGTSFIVPQSCTRIMIADSGQTSWYPAAPTPNGVTQGISLTGVTTGGYALTLAQAAATVLRITGTMSAGSPVLYYPPSGFVGIMNISCSWTNSSGQPVGIVANSQSGSSVLLLTAKGTSIAVYDNNTIQQIGQGV